MAKRFVAVGFVVAGTLLVVGTYGAVVSADHTWGNPAYHWARKTPSFNLLVVNSTTSDWDPYVKRATEDWSISTSLNMIEEGGSASKKVRRRCNPVSGKVRICNDNYGSNGWLGVAGIWFDGQGHITQGYTKLNDTLSRAEQNWTTVAEEN